MFEDAPLISKLALLTPIIGLAAVAVCLIHDHWAELAARFARDDPQHPAEAPDA